MQRAVGHLALVLHAHLPFVRHPEHHRFLEESWLYEAVAEVYLPLLRVLQGWASDGIAARITLSISPTLAAMWKDPLLMSRAQDYLDSRLELMRQEVIRCLWQPDLRSAIQQQQREWLANRLWWQTHPSLLAAFQELESAGIVELITTSATHAILPFMEPSTGAAQAQIRYGIRQHSQLLKNRPQGFWLPECAHHAPLNPMLAAEGIRWTILDRRLPKSSRKRRPRSQPSVLQLDSGLIAFIRDPSTATRVWSREHGYPSHADYRDFYRDVGFEADLDYVEPYLPSPGLRGFTGVKPYRITGLGVEKRPYHPQQALRRAWQHAQHFLRGCAAHCSLEQQMGFAPEPIIVAPYDAELFGHWWHEGPLFLDAVGRLAQQQTDVPALVTLSDHLNTFAIPKEEAYEEQAASTWGAGGCFETWLNPVNAWIFPALRSAERAFAEALRTRAFEPGHATRHHLQAAGASLLQAQASDWPFHLQPGAESGYARRRITQHLEEFWSELQATNSVYPPTRTDAADRGPEFPEVRLEDWLRESIPRPTTKEADVVFTSAS